MSVFDELLAIKRFREGQSELRVARERGAHLAAEEARDAAEQTLARFRDEAQRRELAMYADLCARTVRPREIEDVMLGVAGLREAERQREAELEQARERAAAALRALKEARDAHQVATRMTQKFVELAQLHLDERLREQEQKEDLEMEEAASVRRDREDWEEHAEVDLG